MKVVLANGCFDILHAGHVEHLQEARTFGDRLLVSLTVDHAVNKGPGRPVNAWFERAQVLRELRCVDGIIPTESAVEAILRIRPAVFVKGIDYAGGDKFTEDIDAACKEVGAVIRYTSARKRSATQIIKDAYERDRNI